MNFVVEEILIPIFVELSCGADDCVSCDRFLVYGFLELVTLVTLEGNAVVKECILLIELSWKISSNFISKEFLSR